VSETREAPAATQDALQLLRADHCRIDRLLEDCARLARGRVSSSPVDRSGLLARLGVLLLAHARIEEELFYPALSAAPMAVGDARTDHDQVEVQFKRLNIGSLSTVDFDAGITVLSGLVHEHVVEEEEHLFAHAHALDLQELGARIALRRAELLGIQGED
jgi:hypothetical protein